MNLIIWLAICFVATIFFNQKLQILLLAIPVIWILVPWVASELITGIPLSGNGSIPSIHAGSWTVIVVFGVQVLTKFRYLHDVAKRHWIFFSYVFIFVFLEAVVTISQFGNKGITSILYLTVIPFLYLWLIIVESKNNANFAANLRTLVIIISVVQSLLALCQFALKDVIFFESYYSSYYWWPEKLTRSIGTMDHPLTLAMLLVAAIALSFGLKRNIFQLTTALLLLAAIITTGSRVGLVLGVTVIVISLLTSNVSLTTRFLLSIGIGSFTLLVLTEKLLPGALDRFNDDSGSTRVRFLAYDLFFEKLPEYLFSGGGASHSYQVLSEAGLSTSFESTFLTYVIDFGLVPSFLLFLGLTILAFSSFKSSLIINGRLAFLFAFIMINSFSGGTVQSTAMSILWMLAGISAFRIYSESPASQRREIEVRSFPRGTND